MDAPENSGSRIARTIWTVWGYLSGAVARYLRPEVTDKGNQSVNSRSDEAAVNKTDKEVKAESSESQHDKNTAEIKGSSPDVRAQVQWENTGVVKDDSNDELNIDIPKKQTYRFAKWSTGTESMSGDAHAKKETANSEPKESDATHGLEEIGQTEQGDAKNKECDCKNQDEKGVTKVELDHADILVQSELQEQDEKLGHGENEAIGGLKHADTNEVEFVHQNIEETIKNDEEKVQDLPPLLEYRKKEAGGLSKPETLNLLDTYSDEVYKFSKNELDQGPGTEGATEQEDSETSQKIKQTGKTKEEDKECDWKNQNKNCVMKDELYDADILVQSELQEQDVDEKTDHGENEAIGGLKHADTNEVEFVHQNIEETIKNDEEKVQDLPPALRYSRREADGLSKPETLNLLDAYSDEVYEFSKNKLDQGPGTEGATKQEDSETSHKITQTGKTKEEDSKNKECDWNNQDEKCVMKDELDHADILVQSELQKQVEKPDHGENEVIGGLQHADTNEVEFADGEMIENDEEKVQDLPPLLEYRTGGLSVAEKLNLLDTYSDDFDEFFKNEADQVELGSRSATEKDKDRETSHEIKLTGKTEQDDQRHEDDKCMMKKEDLGYTSITVQSDFKKQTEKRDPEETEDITEAGEHVMDQKGTKIFEMNDQGENEKDEETALKSQSEDVLPQFKYSIEDTLSNAEKQNLMETYCSESAENAVGDMLLASEKDEDVTEREQNTTTSELQSTETLHKISNEVPETHEPNNELESKMTTVLVECFETVNTSEDTMLSDSKQDTPENTTETGTGSPVIAVNTEGMFSDVIVCKFPGELRKEISSTVHFEESKTYLNDLQSVSERHLERDVEFACTAGRSETLKPTEEAVEVEKDIETLIESLGAAESQEICHKLSLMEDVELSTKLMSEHEKAESFETKITLESRERLEFARGECKSSQDTMVDTLSESLGHSDGSAEVEQVADVDSILTRSLPPSEFVKETPSLASESERFIEEQEILMKTALDYVEEITNQVLKEMIETEMLKKTEHSVELSVEELGDAECQGTANSVSAEAFVLEEDKMVSEETMESNVQMEVETSSEDFKQNEQHTSSPKLETTEAERHHEQQTHYCGELSTRTDYLATNQDDSDIDKVKDDDALVKDKEASSKTKYANIESKESESAQELEKNWQIEQKDDDGKCKMPIKKEDPDSTDMVRSELYGEYIEEYKRIKMMDLEETEGTGGLRFSNKHFTHEKEKNIDQNDHERAEDDENQQPEVEAPADAFVLEEEIVLVGETMDSKVELEVETTRIEDVKQNEQHTSSPKLKSTEAERHHEQRMHHCVKLSTGSENLGSNQEDTDIEEHKADDAHGENEEASSEREYANIECKDNEKNWWTEQKDGFDEKSSMAMKNEDSDHTDMVQSELYGEYVEEYKQIKMVDLEKTEGTGGLRHSDEHFTNEKKKNVDQNDQERAEDDENQQPEVEAPAGAIVLDKETMLVGETMDGKVEMEVETTRFEDVKQNEQHTSSPKLETTEAERHHEQQTHHCVKLSAGSENLGTNQEDTDIEEHKADDAHGENEEASSERQYANIECKDHEKNWWTEQKDGFDEKSSMAMKNEDSDHTDMVQSELYGEYVEEYKQIKMVDLEETEGTGGLRHSGEHFTDTKKKNIDQNDQEKAEDDENQQPEVEAPADALVLEEETMLVGETMAGKVEMEVETTSSGDVKQNEQHTSSPKLETTKTERHHEQQTHHCLKLSTGSDYLGSNQEDTDIEEHKADDAHGENEEASSETESKDCESAHELQKDWQIEQQDDEEKCTMPIKKEDPENADIVQSELCGVDIEEEQQIKLADIEEAEGTGGLRHSDDHFTDEKEKNVDQNDQEHEDDENQQPELQAPADAFVLEEETMLVVETMDGKVEMEAENTRIEEVKIMCEADGGHEKIQKVIAGETLLRSHEDVMEVSKPVMKRRFGQVNKDNPEVKIQGISFSLQDSSLDFTVQKSRIAVKNPLVRPPKDPRKLISKASVEPLLPQPAACSSKVSVSPLNKGMIGFKLPGLGAGMPVLRKTEFGKKAREGGEAEETLQPQQKSVAEPEDSVKPVQTTAKPKWTPPRHPGMGGPMMMAELKNKLKKPSNE